MWKLTTITDGKLSCDNFDMNSGDLPDILKILSEKFDITPTKGFVTGLDMTAGDFDIDGKK